MLCVLCFVCVMLMGKPFPSTVNTEYGKSAGKGDENVFSAIRETTATTSQTAPTLVPIVYSVGLVGLTHTCI